MEIGHIQVNCTKHPSDISKVRQIMRRLKLSGYVQKDIATKFIYSALKKYKGFDMFFVSIPESSLPTNLKG